MNSLTRLVEFQELLADYHVSGAGKQALAKARLVLCSAATATGRNTIIDELVKTGQYYYIVSDTTRKPRSNDGVLERDGVEYWFRTEQQMLDDIQSGKMIEAEVLHRQQVSGISIREITKAAESGKIAITDADREGVKNIVAAKPDTICIFFLPPSYDVWQKRIQARGKMEEAEYARRMETARLEIQNALDQPYYQFVINDDLAVAIAEVDAIATGKVNKTQSTVARQVAQDILQELNK